MTDQEQEDALLGALRTAFADGNRRCSAHGDKPAGVLILWLGHLRGVWFCREGRFHFVPGGYASPTISVDSLDDALDYTLRHVCQ
ncbi:MAG TPA: hypothetical protein PK970_05065 [Hyphomicrobiaceae bacterium]|nr:hypothetical protein [Hyphomicrobiaceae bacterium]